MRVTIYCVSGAVREVNDIRCVLGAVHEVNKKLCVTKLNG